MLASSTPGSQRTVVKWVGSRGQNRWQRFCPATAGPSLRPASAKWCAPGNGSAHGWGRANRLDDFRQLKRSAAALGRGRSGRSLLALFLQLLADTLALEAGKIVDEELAIDVVHLMLDADGENFLAIALEHVAVA